MFTTSPTMPASAENSYLVYEIGFFHTAADKVRKTFLGIIFDTLRAWCAFAQKQDVYFKPQSMKKYLSLIFYIIFHYSCSVSKNQTQNFSSCINNKIENFKNETKQNPPRTITQYSYKVSKVYYISTPCCDQFGEVFDSKCNLLGHPDGGITGKGDGSLPGFFAEATEEKLIWKDVR